MSTEPIDEWIEELKKRGIKTFANSDLPNDLRDRTMIIRAKYTGAIIKRSKRPDSRVVWEVA